MLEATPWGRSPLTPEIPLMCSASPTALPVRPQTRTSHGTLLQGFAAYFCAPLSRLSRGVLARTKHRAGAIAVKMFASRFDLGDISSAYRHPIGHEQRLAFRQFTPYAHRRGSPNQADVRSRWRCVLESCFVRCRAYAVRASRSCSIR